MVLRGLLLSQWLRSNLWQRLWRRKHILLALILVSTCLLLLAINYNSFSSVSSLVLHELKTNKNENKNEINLKTINARNEVNSNSMFNSLKNRRNISNFISKDKTNENEKQFVINKNNDLLINKKKKVEQQEYGIFEANVDFKQKFQNQNNININANNHKILNKDSFVESNNKLQKKYIPALRLVHIDLKGAPPKLNYFKQIFPLLKEAGANGLLLEYEDMFPFWDQLKAASAGNAYSKEDIEMIVSLAQSHQLEVIPLIQTFGHLEFFLKLKEFRHLREIDDFPQAICPSKNDSFDLIKQIVDQVLSMHPNSKYLHIGCDEVYHLGLCDKCRLIDRDTLFLSQVARVAKYVVEKHSKIPIIWDDMLRQIPTERIKEFKLNELGVEPMVWTYIKDIYRFIPYSQWITFSEIFPHIWSASAFKGAFGETLTVPNIKMHLENNEAWIEVMAEQEKNFKSIRGIAITGWQRYDHLATLCELFPSGFPSLVINLLTTTEGGFDKNKIFKKFDKIMGCNQNNNNPNTYYGSQQEVDFESDPHLFNHLANCYFPGSSVYHMIQHHSEAVKRVNDYLYDVTIHKAWLTDYNIRHNISSPYRVEEGLQEYSSVYYGLQAITRTAKEALKEVYDDYTVLEWIEQNIYPYLLKMEKLMENSVNLKKAKVWPKRPLNTLEDLKRFL